MLRFKLSKYDFAKDPVRLAKAMEEAAKKINGQKSCIIDGDSWKTAWRKRPDAPPSDEPHVNARGASRPDRRYQALGNRLARSGGGQSCYARARINVQK